MDWEPLNIGNEDPDPYHMDLTPIPDFDYRAKNCVNRYWYRQCLRRSLARQLLLSKPDLTEEDKERAAMINYSYRGTSLVYRAWFIEFMGTFKPIQEDALLILRIMNLKSMRYSGSKESRDG